MKIIKLLLFIFMVYFVRRFINMYRYMKAMEARGQNAQPGPQEFQKSTQAPDPNAKIVEADFKVID